MSRRVWDAAVAAAAVPAADAADPMVEVRRLAVLADRRIAPSCRPF